MSDFHGLVAKKDCTLVRDHPDYQGSIVAYDADGEIIERFDGDWTDEMVFKAIEFANRAHDIGFHRGEAAKAHAIRAALGCAEKE
ncbi:MAG: hypothetical protein M0T84_07165 [Betaproteobacteria bacterium]|nr:hypothetical protein [Betaproteobacteria bacterium]